MATRVSSEHCQFVVDNMKKMSTREMREALMEKGLVKSQANDCIRNQKIKAGEHKNSFLDSTYNAIKGKKPGKWKFKGSLAVRNRRGKRGKTEGFGKADGGNADGLVGLDIAMG